MKTINSLSKFIESLDESEVNSYPNIINSLVIPSSEFEEFATWNSDKYTRNCIARTENYELILLCWDNK